jgi:hypothetical protein
LPRPTEREQAINPPRSQFSKRRHNQARVAPSSASYAFPFFALQRVGWKIDAHER